MSNYFSQIPGMSDYFIPMPRMVPSPQISSPPSTFMSNYYPPISYGSKYSPNPSPKPQPSPSPNPAPSPSRRPPPAAQPAAATIPVPNLTVGKFTKIGSNYSVSLNLNNPNASLTIVPIIKSSNGIDITSSKTITNTTNSITIQPLTKAKLYIISARFRNSTGSLSSESTPLRITVPSAGGRRRKTNKSKKSRKTKKSKCN